MFFLTLSDLDTRLIATYLAQCILGLILFFIFRHFSILYIRRFLRSWANSWIAFSGYMFCTAIMVITVRESRVTFLTMPLSFLAQTGCFLHIVFLLVGTYQLIYVKPIKRRLKFLILATTVIVSLVTVLVFSHDPNTLTERYLTRIGSRTFVSCIGFLLAGVVMLKSPRLTKGFGQTLMGICFILFSVDQLFYFIIVLFYVFGKSVEVPSFFGLIDLLVISLMGMSMVMWLLENEREKLAQVNQNLDSFIYSTSHDLKSPIASILGLTFIGKLELAEPKAHEFMGLIENRTKKLDAIISGILSLARSKKFDVKIEDVDFNKLIEETISDIQFTRGASSIALNYQQDTSNIFRSDYHKMKIVMSNLIANAVKYHNLEQPEPKIDITFHRVDDDHVQICVADNGRGISAASLPKIFDMFYRGTSSGDGTGLGLFIVKEALEKVKGKISVSSEYGKGSTFTVVLNTVEA